MRIENIHRFTIRDYEFYHHSVIPNIHREYSYGVFCSSSQVIIFRVLFFRQSLFLTVDFIPDAEFWIPIFIGIIPNYPLRFGFQHFLSCGIEKRFIFLK